MKSTASVKKEGFRPFMTRLPGSKSYTNRALVIAAQRPGHTKIDNALHADDTLRLAEALNKFDGLSVGRTDAGFSVSRASHPLGAPSEDLHLGGAGTPARLLISFATSVKGSTVITGNARLRERPMGDLIESLRQVGYRIDELGSPNCLPVRVHGGFPSHRGWAVRGSVSSQFLTSLLVHAAQLPESPISIRVLDHLVSKPYVRMTLAMLKQCGIQVETSDLTQFVVHPRAPQREVITIETDASAMSYLLAAAALTQTAVEVPGISLTSEQGDVGFARLLQEMGCGLTQDKNSITLCGGPLRGISVDMESMPDTVLTLAVVAAFARGTTEISNIANLRVKECDRIHAAAAGLSRLGIETEEGADFLTIHASPSVGAAQIDTFDDHRVAMAFAIAGLVRDGIQVEDPACVRKSFPGFWDELARFQTHNSAMKVAR